MGLIRKKLLVASLGVTLTFIPMLGTNQVEASSTSTNIIKDAKQLINVPYVWGGTSPSGFDCSGFLNYVYEKNNITLPRSTEDIYNNSLKISDSELVEGDLVFFSTYKPGPSHSGIYIGDNKFIHASSSSGVVISSLDLLYWKSRYLGAGRVMDPSVIPNEIVVISKTLKKYYSDKIVNENDLVVTKEFMDLYNKVSNALNQNNSYSTQSIGDSPSSTLSEVKDYHLNAARFIDGVKVGDKLEVKEKEMRAQINAQMLNDETVATYDELSYQIRKTEEVIGKVYGGKNRDLFLSKYITYAKIARETVIYEVSRYKLLENIEQLINNGEYEEANSKIAMLERLEKRSIDIKKAGNDLYPGKYPSLPEIEKDLLNLKNSIINK